MIEQWLPLLADPMALRTPPATVRVDERTLLRLIDQAAVHGILPAVIKNLRQWHAAAALDIPDEQMAIALKRGEEKLFGYTGTALHLRSQSEEILQAFRERGIPGIVFKGPQFADRLYPSSAMRTYTDIDLLVRKKAVPQAAAALGELGYTRQELTLKYDDYGETLWLRSERSGGAVELHWNLVNSPRLRSRLSVEYDDLDVANGKVSASALLLMAAVHAAASHSFDRLGPLVDILQCVRQAAGALDRRWLIAAVRQTGAAICMAPALTLTARLFDEPLCTTLLRDLELNDRGLWSHVLTPGMVLSKETPASKIRRKIYRELVKRA